MKRTANLAAIGLIALMTALTGCVATVAAPPPVARVEVHPPVPFIGAVWIGGYYEYHHSRYEWVPGRYVRPPHPKAVWVPGRWDHDRRGWNWHRGHWR